VLKDGKELVLESARETLDEAELVSEPWAVACAAEAAPGSVLVDVGGGTVTVTRIGTAAPSEAETRVISGGGDAIDVELAKLLREHHKGAEFSVAAARELKERHGCHLEGGPVSAGLSIGGRTMTVDVALELAQACRSVVPGILEAVKAVAPAGPVSVVLTGGGSQMKGLDRLIEEGLRQNGGKVTRAAEPILAGAMGALVIAVGATRA
jgi:actin-like ATPase involved in cell morphogenesis